MKRKCIVKYALVLGVVILMYSVGVIPVISTANSDIDDIETKETLFQTFKQKIEEISDLDCGCGKNNTEVTDFPILCTLLFLTYWFLYLYGRFFSLILVILGIILDIAQDLDCWWR